jgi:ABC-type multidrug transport system ATPase subunit
MRLLFWFIVFFQAMSTPAELGSMRPDGDDDIELAPLSAPTTIFPAAEVPVPKALSASTAGLPELTIAYHNASIGLDVSVSKSTVKTVFSPLVDLGRAITGKSESRTLWRVHNASGVIRPGTMTMVLAPPGHGKSTMLRLMSDRLRPDENNASAGVRFNGMTVHEASDAGCSVRRLCHIVDQVDQHLPLLTVRETLDFAHQCTSRVQDPARVESVIKLLGLTECQNTIIGDALIRGVSGGQKRRVTVGEMLVGDARAIFLDEYTNGLDTATAEDITRGLRKWVLEMNASVVVTVQQPTPGLFAQFDDIIILNNADVMYHGPRDDVVPYFASMGFSCPDDVDVCDFVIDCVSQPRVALERLQHSERSAARAAKAAGIVRDPSAALASTKGQLVRSATPCVTAQQMLTHYHTSPFYAEIVRDIKPFFPDATFPSGVASTAASDLKVLPLLPSDEAKATYSTGFVQPIGTLLKMVLTRQGKIVARNEGMVMPRIFQAILMGLIYGSVYFRIPTEQFFLRVVRLSLPIFCHQATLQM